MSDDSLPFTTPTLDMDADEVELAEFEYSDRAPGDYVVSGVLAHEYDLKAVETRLRRQFGARFKRMLTESIPYGRWTALIRGL